MPITTTPLQILLSKPNGRTTYKTITGTQATQEILHTISGLKETETYVFTFTLAKATNAVCYAYPITTGGARDTILINVPSSSVLVDKKNSIEIMLFSKSATENVTLIVESYLL